MPLESSAAATMQEGSCKNVRMSKTVPKHFEFWLSRGWIQCLWAFDKLQRVRSNKVNVVAWGYVMPRKILVPWLVFKFKATVWRVLLQVPSIVRLAIPSLDHLKYYHISSDIFFNAWYRGKTKIMSLQNQTTSDQHPEAEAPFPTISWKQYQINLFPRWYHRSPGRFKTSPKLKSLGWRVRGNARIPWRTSYGSTYQLSLMKASSDDIKRLYQKVI